ncbi:RNA-binding protein [Synechocystis sp. LKSZ1]|uniref:RNA recognition motif domain-containing protein n=1 Tax=Synechocystis sp. LKSZ1 TaxID=3144951 RepID=UPI00336BF0EA
MSVRLYVGNLPKEAIEREALQEVFAEANAVVSTKVIKDRKTGKCRGFAFVTVSTDEAADEFIEKYNGQSFMDSELKIEKALPREKGKKEDEEEGAEGPSLEANSDETAAPTSKAKKSDKKRGGRTRNQGQANVVSSGLEGFQPDPRWASQLALLKEQLAATNN